MSDLEGAVGLVTGAAGGLGREIVALLHGAGAAVVAEDIDPAVGELERPDGRIVAVQGDVADGATARAAVKAAHDGFGRLDVLVNNAARFLLKPALETTDAEWDALMATNVRGTFVHCREALPSLIAAQRSAIVNVASISGLVGLPGQPAYCATKGAIIQLTRQLAVEHAGDGVRVNAVAPGAIRTGFMREALPDTDEVFEQIGASHPLGRVASAAEVAETVVFLASPRASFVTGAVLAVDGGYTAQ